MRKLTHLSPTSIADWLVNTEEFYLKYLADDQPPRVPQTPAMAVGSAFDAYVKSYIQETLFGPDPSYAFDTLFEKQVEEQCRDVARGDGESVFKAYQRSGALADLMTELELSSVKPRFEFTVIGQHGGVTFKGKPDAYFVTRCGHHVILDWKVNGFYSAKQPSPSKGYVNVRTESGTSTGCHKDAMLLHVGNIVCNASFDFAVDWARQTCIYSWICFGTPDIAAVDQVCCPSRDCKPYRIAQHRYQFPDWYTSQLMTQAAEIWRTCTEVPSGGSLPWIFRNMSYEDSTSRAETLDQMAASLRGAGDYFNAVTRGF